MNKVVSLFLAAILAPSVWAVDTTITTLFGSGIPDTGWTAITVVDSITETFQLGLRARNTLTNEIPSNGGGFYTFEAGTSWNFDSSYTRFNNAIELGGSSWRVSLTISPDPINPQLFAPLSFNLQFLQDPNAYYGFNYATGSADTVNGGGVHYDPLTTTSSNFAQKTLNLDMYQGLSQYNPGVYDLRLLLLFGARNPRGIAEINIKVLVTPSATPSVPDGRGTAGLFVLGLGVVEVLRRRFGSLKSPGLIRLHQ